jgi:hypothetical protein
MSDKYLGRLMKHKDYHSVIEIHKKVGDLYHWRVSYPTCNNMGKHGGEMKEDLLKQDYVYHYDESGE